MSKFRFSYYNSGILQENKSIMRLISTYILLLCSVCLFAQQDMQRKFQTQFIAAEDGSTIQLPEGRFELNKSLWLDGKKDITIRGAGMDKTILSFKKQTEGAEGIKVTNAKNIRIEDLSVQESKGDAIKTQDVAGIAFIRVKTEWLGRPDKKNGAYGLYPVQCSDVLIDGCEAIGASDAGIYVGQSNRVIVRNCRAYRNVAGIEIENTLNADVYDNLAEGNTGGILVFDLPGLIQKKGGNVRVYNNMVKGNNYRNYAPEGNSVADVPPGTGIMVLATSDVEVFNNTITNNRTMGAAIASYLITERKYKDDGYDPYPSRIYIHDNKFDRGKKRPILKNKMGALLAVKFGKNAPDIVYDGIPNEEHLDADGNLKEAYQICIRDNGAATFANINAAKGIKNINQDVSPFDCTREKLKTVELLSAGIE